MLELFFVSLYFYICSNGLKGQEALYERSLSEAVIEKLAEDRNILAPDIKKNLLGIPSKTSNATNTFLHANKHNLIFKQINGVDKCPGKLNYFCEQLTGDNLYQVNNEVREFKNEKNGPQLINISFTINKTGETVILPWFEVKGAPVNELGGDQVIQAIAKDGSIISEFRFTPEFRVLFEPAGPEEYDEAFVVAEFPFDALIDRIIYRDSSNNIIFSIDPLNKITRDYIDVLLEVCMVGDDQRNNITSLYSQINQDFLKRELSSSTIDKYNNIITILSTLHPDECQFGGSLFESTPDLAAALESLIEKLKLREAIT